MHSANPDTRPPKTKTHDSDFRLPAVDRAMSLFELLAYSQRGLTLSELSRKLNIPKSTVHYLVHTLMTRGYVERGPNRQFLLGLRFADMAEASLAPLHLRTSIVPYLRQISSKTNLTVTAAVLRGIEAVIIAKIRSYQDNRGGAWLGAHVDLHCTAHGKALLATLTNDQLDKMYEGRELCRCTSYTIGSLTGLKEHLAHVREEGFSVNDQEHVLDLRAVAVPVFNSAAGYVMTICARGNLNDIPTSRIPKLGKELVVASREISQQLSSNA
jgi:IclR family KDG regulon transcriptional repressor